MFVCSLFRSILALQFESYSQSLHKALRLVVVVSGGGVITRAASDQFPDKVKQISAFVTIKVFAILS